VKISFISIFSLFVLIFKHDFIRCVDFTCIAASKSASDDVKNYVTHILNTGLLYSYANFVVEIDKKSILNGGF